MLGWRLGISAVLIPSLIGLFIWDAKLGDSAPVLLVLCLLLTVRATWESVHLLRQKTPELGFAGPAAINVCMVLATWLPHWNLIELPDVEASRWMRESAMRMISGVRSLSWPVGPNGRRSIEVMRLQAGRG